MKLRIEIECDNAAFDDNEGEIERILTDLGSRLPTGNPHLGDSYILHDANGNWVGYAKFMRGEAKES